MKRWILIAAFLLAVAGIATGGYWMIREPAPRWTTSSAAALKAFEQGFDELSKIYFADAYRSFQRAVELDPDFAVAKKYLAYVSEKADQERLDAELEAVDFERLKPEERFIVRSWLAREKPAAERQRIVDAFLAEYPENFFGLRARCDGLWKAERWEEAESCYRRLLELHPNWVQGENRLGYIAMARGRFSEAEERFRTYRYVAPDQANPYDSMAELLMLLGRYDEAEASLAEALRIKPDFCHAYDLRARIAILSGRFERVEEAMEDLESFPACDRFEDEGVPCAMRAGAAYFQGDVEGAWQRFDGACLERLHGFHPFAHRAAVATGRVERGLEMEEALRGKQQQAAEAGKSVAADRYGALLAHMEGARSLLAGDFPAAIERLETADRMMAYWGDDRAAFKLWNRLNLMRALELDGEAARAEAVRRKLAAVNPRILDDLRIPDLAAG